MTAVIQSVRLCQEHNGITAELRIEAFGRELKTLMYYCDSDKLVLVRRFFEEQGIEVEITGDETPSP